MAWICSSCMEENKVTLPEYPALAGASSVFGSAAVQPAHRHSSARQMAAFLNMSRSFPA